MDQETSQIVLIFVFSAIFVVFMAIILILFLVIYQKKIVTQKNRLQQLENERQQSLLKATIEGQERERERLAKDLHDDIGSLLSGLSLNLKFQKNRKHIDQEQKRFLEEACQMVAQGIENVRNVSHNLLPTTLEEFGLLQAMKECIEPVLASNKIHVDIGHSNPVFPLPKTIALGLLRVFQELLQNTIKHANASKVEVYLEYQTAFINFTYQDNGVGFDPTTSNSDGIGMKNIESRISALQGNFHLNTELSSGYHIQIRIPTPQNTSL
jgi:signal transduction histidine kinase